MENLYKDRVSSLRAIMAAKGWDAVILTGSDPHCSEYPADRWKQVQWLSGFTGEAGDIVVTEDHVGLWTDTRYFIQANQQLEGTGIVLHKTRVPEQVLIPEWLSKYDFHKQDNPVVIAVDGLSQGVGAVKDIIAAFEEQGKSSGVEGGVKIVSVPDILDSLWMDRPAVPYNSIITLGVELVGKSRMEKINAVRDTLKKKGCDAILVTALDEIAWVLNVRGSDIEYNPLVISYLLITEDNVFWYTKKSGFVSADTKDTYEELRNDGVEICLYDDIFLSLIQQFEDGMVSVLWADPGTLNYHIYSLLISNGHEESLRLWNSPVGLMKAVKNTTEIEGMREAHLYDGAAVEKFLFWLEDTLARGEDVSERDAADKLCGFRQEIPEYRGNSFDTISAYGPGAALPHYITPKSGAPLLERHGLYLVDSGGQYMNGTTDITRTIPLGPCTMLEKKDYTLVLKGHIDLAMAVFPRGTAGCQLDILARNPLWREGRNFGHGTGHGVGFFSVVHEGPQEFRQNFNKTAFLPGMITSNEPGLYREGMHGVRHENMMLCVEDNVNAFGDWLRFTPMTMCHFDTSILMIELLTREEKEWLNEYNASVLHNLAPLLSPQEAAWLEDKCAEI